MIFHYPVTLKKIAVNILKNVFSVILFYNIEIILYILLCRLVFHLV